VKALLRAVRRGANRISSAALEASIRVAAVLSPTFEEAPASPRSIFVLRNNDIGDLLVVTPLFDALHRRFPEACIVAGVGDWNRDVLWGNPHVSEVLPVNAPWFNKYQEQAGPLGRLAYLRRSPEVQALAERRCEIGIDVLGSAWGSLLMLETKIPFRLGVRGYAGGHSAVQAAVDFDPNEHVGRSALRFAELLGATDLPPNRPQLFLTADERAEAERWWAAAGRGPRVVIAPGGGLAARRWPVEGFAAVAAGLKDVSILALGGPREDELAARVAAANPTVRSFSSPPGLREVFALIATADLVVCNSSLPLHVAAAFGKPAVVLLGESFASARQHQAQWGYPGLSTSLGKEPEQRELPTPEAALATVRRHLARS
jgi:ADP-heptose:LPS heptosyltransferase